MAYERYFKEDEETKTTVDYITDSLLAAKWKKSKQHLSKYGTFEKAFRGLGSKGGDMNPEGNIMVYAFIDEQRGRWLDIGVGWYTNSYDGRDFGITPESGKRAVSRIEKDIKNHQSIKSGFTYNGPK
jgi:hypothetical protein